MPRLPRALAIPFLIFTAVTLRFSLGVVGAPKQDSPSLAGQLVRIVLEPSDVVLKGTGARQQLLVTGDYGDGSLRDLTGKATFSTDQPERVRLRGSVAFGIGDGPAKVVATVGTQQASLSVIVRDSGILPAVSFTNEVMAVLSRSGCNQGTCHGNFNGKNGFRLSLRGENPAFDLNSLARDTHGRRTNIFDPGASLILQKPTGQVPHEGGIRFHRDSDEYRILERWVRAGLKPDSADALKLARLEVWPRERILLHGANEQQLVARAHFSDGSARDVTHLVCFEASVEYVQVSPDGVARTDKAGEATIVVRYLDQRVPVRLAFVPPRPDFRWQPVAANNYIDDHIFARLRALQIQPAELCDDTTFLRRAYLDVLGALPTIAETKAFLADRTPAKRAKLIDQLLERPEYADYWASKWADLLRNEEKAVDAKGVRLFYQWLRQAVSDDMPLDQFARELLTARGSTYSNPPANYYRTNLQPTKAAETTAQLFMGVRVACAKCHNHPFDRWTQEDYYGLSAFFARVRTRMLDNQRRDKLDKHELVGEMIVWLDREGEVNHPTREGPMSPRLPGGSVPQLGAAADRLPALADWLTRRDNPFFARVMANRIWHGLMGRGLVEPVDDVRESNPASNEPLLEALARDLAKHGSRQKHLIRTIMNSRTYQPSGQTNPTNAEDEANFSHARPRRLAAEPLLDALSQVTEVPEEFKGYPKGTRAVQLPGLAGQPRFLVEFGRPERLLACECERRHDVTLNQVFLMINSETVGKKVQESPRIDRLLLGKASAKDIGTELYLAALARYPTDRELELIATHLGPAPDRRKLEDLLWAVVNMREFLLRR
jgi:hypothetical protein